MPIVTDSVGLDVNQALIYETEGELKATAYFEDYLFKLFADISNVNLAGGVVLTLTLPGTTLELEQSTGVSPITVDLSSLDGRTLSLSLAGTDLELEQTTGTTPITADLSSLDGRVLTLTFDADTDILTLTQSTGTSPINVDLSVDPQRKFLENMGNASLVQSDFTISGIIAEGVSAVAAGGGAGIFSPAPAGGIFTDHPGIWQMNTGTSPNGRVFVISRFASYNVGVGGITCVGTWLRTGTPLSDAVTRYTIRAGFSSVVLPDTLLNAISFEYRDDQNGGRWQAVTFDGVETSTDTGVLVAVDTWYRLEFEINAAGTSVEFFIDGISVATIVTNIPSGFLFGLFYNCHILKVMGAGARAIFLDAYYIYQALTR